MNTFEDEIRCLESYKNLEGIISKCTKDRGSLETSAGISRVMFHAGEGERGVGAVWSRKMK